MILVVFNQTITLGTIILGALMGVAGISTFFYGIRWKSNYEVQLATSNTLREGRDAFLLRSERLEGELHACKEELSKLEATRSLEPLLQAVLEGFRTMEGRFARHEERAQERHQINQAQGEAHLKILEMIADKVGPDREWNGHDRRQE